MKVVLIKQINQGPCCHVSFEIPRQYKAAEVIHNRYQVVPAPVDYLEMGAVSRPEFVTTTAIRSLDYKAIPQMLTM